MDLGGERLLVRCGTVERRCEAGKLEAMIDEVRRASPVGWIEVRRLGLVRG
jgi:hypothetical protein